MTIPNRSEEFQEEKIAPKEASVEESLTKTAYNSADSSRRLIELIREDATATTWE